MCYWALDGGAAARSLLSHASQLVGKVDRKDTPGNKYYRPDL